MTTILIDSGSAHFGFATTPLPRPAVDFTFGSMAWRRASFASGPEVAFFPGRLDDWSFCGSAMDYKSIVLAGVSARILFTKCLAREGRARSSFYRNHTGNIHAATRPAPDLQL